MVSVLEELKRREAVALARVERLRAEALAVADRLDAARIELSRLVIARRTVVEALAACRCGTLMRWRADGLGRSGRPGCGVRYGM